MPTDVFSATIRKGRWLAWLVGLAALVSVILLATHFSEERALARLLRNAKPEWLALALALQSLTYLCETRIWRALIHSAGERLSMAKAMGLSIGKLFIDQALPSGGLSGTLFFVQNLSRSGIRKATAMAGLAVATLSYYGAYLVCLAIALAVAAAYGTLHPPLVWTFVAFALGSALFCAAIVYLLRRGALPFASLIKRVPTLQRGALQLRRADLHLVRDPRLLSKALGWQAIIFLLDSTTLWLCLLATGVFCDPAEIFASYMFASLFRTLAFLPGGLGAFEAASVLTLKAAGVSVVEGLTATLLFRGLSFWLPMLPGMLAATRMGRDASPFSIPLQQTPLSSARKV